jgi:hypothetical protein
MTIYIRKGESRVQIADRYAPWNICSVVENLRLGTDRKENNASNGFSDLVFIRCLAIAHLFDDVAMCLLCQCLSTYDGVVAMGTCFPAVT